MKFKILLAFGLVIVLALAITAVASAVSGAAYTTFNPSVDGDPAEICKNSIINCNIYSAKEYVWLNGGPTANGLGPDGDYFFAVLVPGGQPDPNDGGVKNLSDDYDAYTNRTFTVTDGEVSAYSGDHWLDSGSRNACADKGKGPSSCYQAEPDGLPPYIRLFPYADTWNPGGVYIMAICSLEDGYPVDPRDCKYDAFKVKENGPATASLVLSGMKFEDMYADGVKDASDPGLEGWEIHIYGTGMMGELIDEYVYTDENGAWDFQKDYTYKNKDELVEIQLTVCETPQDGWTQSYPETEDGCYDVTLAPAALAEEHDLDFGNWGTTEVTACKVYDADGDLATTDDQELKANWPVSLTVESVVVDEEVTGADGCYTWTGLTPHAGEYYDVHEGSWTGWVAIESPDYVFPADSAYSRSSLHHDFYNTYYQGCTPGFWQGGNDFGTAGGKWLWNEVNDPQWTASGGAGTNPYIWTTLFNDFFGSDGSGNTMWYYVNPDLWGGGNNDDFHKAARMLTAAYLNSSWGMNYPYSTGELEGMWADAVSSGDFATLHSLLGTANESAVDTDGDGITEHQCPISASGY